MATTVQDERSFNDVLAELERAAAVEVSDPRHWQRVLDTAARLGDDDLALIAARHLVAADPRGLRPRALLADRLAEAGLLREALAVSRKLLDDDPRNPALPLAIAIQLGRLGREDEALASVRVAIRREPQSAIAWETFANLKTFVPDDRDLGELERIAVASPDRPETAGFAYALAKACDDIGDYERAFEWFARGNARVRGSHLPRLDDLFRGAEELRAAFTPALLDAGTATDRPERPILVLGCPRSGTTLVERILTTAPGTASGGELKVLRLACLGFSPPSPERVTRYIGQSGGAKSAWERVAATYIDRLRRRFGTADGVVDKGLVNYLYVGAVALALPNARIVHVRREPMDVAWSCFRRRFHDGLYWSYHYESIAAFLRVYEDTMAHWKQVLPGRILTLDFERLVSSPDEETARLFAHAGLERPADWQSFHDRKGVVMTASQRQVRRPLNADGVQAWRRYERFLGPLQDALSRAGLPVKPAA
ncbi:MAG: sulfotransferase [Steroidobacteraceae bacterium]